MKFATFYKFIREDGTIKLRHYGRVSGYKYIYVHPKDIDNIDDIKCINKELSIKSLILKKNRERHYPNNHDTSTKEGRKKYLDYYLKGDREND